MPHSLAPGPLSPLWVSVLALADRSLIGRLGRLIYARFVSPHRPFANPNHIIASELHLTMPWGPTRRDAARRGLTCSSTAHKLATQDRERLPGLSPSRSQSLVLQSQVIVCDIRRSLVVTCLRPKPRESEALTTTIVRNPFTTLVQPVLDRSSPLT